MLSLKKLKISAFIMVLLSTSIAEAGMGLYGFHHANPYTKEERILNLSEVPEDIHNYRADMRNNLLMLIKYAKQQNPDFKIIAHEGQDLLTKSLWEYDREGYNRARLSENAKDDSFLFHNNYREQEPERYTPAHEYLNLVDAIAINNYYCGKGYENKITKAHKLGLITIEQCSNRDDLDAAQINSFIDHKISYGFTDIKQAFNNINDHNNINDSAKNVYQIKDAQNILILTDDSLYKNKEQLIEALLSTNYDIIIMKPLFADRERFAAEDLQKLHFKKNGSKRLLIAELNVAETSPRDYFWNIDWKINSPQWIARKSFVSEDAFITRFWHLAWQKIISNYFKDILNEGFDGIFFTGVENYRYFEQQSPLE